MKDCSPAPDSTVTARPALTIAFTVSGVAATRVSPLTLSFATRTVSMSRPLYRRKAADC